MIDISLIICTLNRAASLMATLESVTQAIRSAPDLAIEVVLVDNGSNDNTQEIVTGWKSKSSFPVIIVQEFQRGLSHARNAGLSASSGDIIAFTDDDCTLNADYFLALRRHYDRDTVATMRGGRVELGDPTDLPFSIKLEGHKIVMNDMSHPGGFIIGANMTMKREVVDKLGLFDVRFGAGAPFKAAEETDYIYRAQRAKIPVEYVPDLIVQHFHGRKEKNEIVRLNEGYHIGGGALYAKYASQWQLLRHFYWDTRKCFQEMFGGPAYDPTIGLSYRTVVKGNIKGMWLYATSGLRGRFKKA